MSVSSSIALTENKKRKEKVQVKKEESKEQSTYTYTDILQKDICEKRYKINWRRKIEIINFNFIQIDSSTKNKII